MPIILALDVGEKTIGVAFSDESETFALPGETILRNEGHRKDMAVLRNLIEEKTVSEIVVGNPLMMDGSSGRQVEKVEEFVTILRRFTDLPIHLEDERLSTWEAEQALIELGQNRQERKKTIDSLAAASILRTFLETRRRSS
ncbi:MAG: Holliday junction resolvase RuvX [Chthonomonadales bacterium]